MKSIKSPFDSSFGRGPFGASSDHKPVITVPPTQEITLASLPRTFSSGTGRAIVISDALATNLTDVTITVTSGSATLAATTGLSFDIGDGTADSAMSFSGSITNVVSALNGMTVTGAVLPIVVSISAATTKGRQTAFITLNDTIAPTVSSLSPADGATNVALTTSPAVTFSENVIFGTGDIILRRATEIVSVTRAADGETTNLNATLGTFTANVADADGGSDAVRFTANNTSGVASAIRFQTAGNIAFNNGGNSVRFRVKDVGSNAPWIRVGFENTTYAARVWIKPSDGSIGATSALISGLSVVSDAGGDGYVVSYDADITGADVTGAFVIQFASANNSSTMVGTGAEAIRIHDLTIGTRDRERFNVVTDVGSGAGQVSISGAVLTINPSIDLTENEGFSIYIPATAIKDAAGNAFAGILDNTTWNFTTGATDSAAPGILSTYPADNSTNAPVNAILAATFNEAIAFGTGNITLRRNDAGTWSDVEAFNVATEVGTSAGQVNIVEDTLSIYPTSALSNNIEYAVRIAATAIDDLAGNSFPGIADDTTWSFTAYNLALYNFSVVSESGGQSASIDLSYNAQEITDGTFYFVIQPAAVATPSAAQIKDGQNGAGAAATWADSVSYASLDIYSNPATGLTQDTAYEGYAVHQAVDLTYSNVVEYAFSTDDAVPVVSSFTAAPNGAVAGLFSFTTDDPNGSFKWYVSTSSTPPNKTDLVAGTGAVAYGSVSVSGAGAYTNNAITGLSAATVYYVHGFHRDADLNDSAVATTSSFTTTSLRTILYQYANAGATTGLSATNGTLAGSQTDSSGGSNAVSLTCNSAGANTAVSLFPTSQVTLFNGVNYISAKVKKGTWASSGARIRFARSGFTSNGSFSVNLNTATVDSPAGAPNQVCTDLGNGWMYIEQIIDTTAYSDRQGTLTFYMGDAANDQTITAAANHVLYFHDIRVERD